MTDDPIDLLKSLVSINSVNPDLVPGGAGEARIGDFCAAFREQCGWRTRRRGRGRAPDARWPAAAAGGHLPVR